MYAIRIDSYIDVALCTVNMIFNVDINYTLSDILVI